jgi:predicted Zn-dependent protease
MNGVRARYYDGKTSILREAELSLESPSILHIMLRDITLVYPLEVVEVAPRVGSAPRILHLPDGGLCETDDHEAVDAWMRALRKGRLERVVQRWESQLARVITALCSAAVIVWAGLQYGVPVLAREVASTLPEAVGQELGERTLALLDQSVLTPSRLPELRRRHVTALFDEIVENAAVQRPVRLELRGSEPAGANAFALPSGVVVVTDALIGLAHNDGELIAVLAHEIGHVRGRHTLRQLLQTSAGALLISAITGDASSITALGAALPTLLIETKYARDLEMEADDFALDYLQAQGISRGHFADILLRLEEHVATPRPPDFLSTHPDSKERARR